MKLQAQHIGFDNAVAILNQGIQAIDSGDSVMDMQDVRKTALRWPSCWNGFGGLRREAPS